MSTVAAQDYKVADIGLAEFGRKEISLAEHEMPGLMAIREEYAQTQPLAGRARHRLPAHDRPDRGADRDPRRPSAPQVRWASCNIFSTQDHAAAAIAAAGIPVFAWKGETLPEYWWCAEQALLWPDGERAEHDPRRRRRRHAAGPQGRRVRGGGRGARRPARRRRGVPRRPRRPARSLDRGSRTAGPSWRPGIKGVTEETTTGVLRLYQFAETGDLLFPAINVNDSVTKSKFDNLYGCRHSLVDGINRATDVMIGGKVAVICGFGDVGKGCAELAARPGRARDRHRDRPDLRAAGGDGGLRGAQPRRGRRDGRHLRHRDRQQGHHHARRHGADEAPGDRRQHRPLRQRDRHGRAPGVRAPSASRSSRRSTSGRFPDGHSIIVLSEGRLLNLGNATGHPSFVMSNSFTNQTIAQVELYSKNEQYERRVYVLPKHLDEKVARLHLDALGVTLTELTPSAGRVHRRPARGSLQVGPLPLLEISTPVRVRRLGWVRVGVSFAGWACCLSSRRAGLRPDGCSRGGGRACTRCRRRDDLSGMHYRGFRRRRRGDDRRQRLRRPRHGCGRRCRHEHGLTFRRFREPRRRLRVRDRLPRCVGGPVRSRGRGNAHACGLHDWRFGPGGGERLRRAGERGFRRRIRRRARQSDANGPQPGQRLVLRRRRHRFHAPRIRPRRGWVAGPPAMPFEQRTCC